MVKHYGWVAVVVREDKHNVLSSQNRLVKKIYCLAETYKHHLDLPKETLKEPFLTTGCHHKEVKVTKDRSKWVISKGVYISCFFARIRSCFLNFVRWYLFKGKTALHRECDRYPLRINTIVFTILPTIQWAKCHFSSTIFSSLSLSIYVTCFPPALPVNWRIYYIAQ